jgi:hypothetical protein
MDLPVQGLSPAPAGPSLSHTTSQFRESVMNQQQRMAIRAAVLIHEHVAGHGADTDTIQLPEYSWQHVQRLRQQFVRAHERGWRLAEKALVRDLNDALRRVQYELEGAVRRAEAYRQPRPPISPAEIYHDIVALRQEFDELEIDFSSHELVVTTESIVLEGIDFGRFAIHLDWSQIGSSKQPLRVVALDPHPAARNEEVTHPHVQAERLCEGDGRTAIAEALAGGRIYDFFMLVSQVLRTYGRGKAYIELDRWDGALCDDCGDVVDDEDRYGCQGCGNTLCPSCAIPCQHCQDMYCGECMRSCAACGENYCSSCLTVCSGCRKQFCEDCLEEGLCRPCQEAILEEDQDDDSDDEPECEETCPAGQGLAAPASTSV